MDMIISDHHHPGEQLPRLWGSLPQASGGCLSGKKSSGVGLAYKIAQALNLARNLNGYDLEEWWMVALGTVADIVPLTGENRSWFGAVFCACAR
jgi:single-stranded-DNA-specific exonuclease